MNLDVSATAPEIDEDSILGICHVNKRIAGGQEPDARVFGVAEPEYLDLGAHDRVGGGGGKSTCLAHEPGHVGCGGDDGRFFYRHWHKVIAPVHREVRCDAKGQFKRADHVFDHPIRDIQRETPLS